MKLIKIQLILYFLKYSLNIHAGENKWIVEILSSLKTSNREDWLSYAFEKFENIIIRTINDSTNFSSKEKEIIKNNYRRIIKSYFRGNIPDDVLVNISTRVICIAEYNNCKLSLHCSYFNDDDSNVKENDIILCSAFYKNGIYHALNIDGVRPSDKA